MKGQYLAIEYVLFIAIGVAMVIVVYSIFTNISNTIEGGTTQAQIERTAELIRSMIVNTYEVAHRTNSQIIYNLGIPPELSDCIYSIEADNSLVLSCTDNNKINAELNLYGIEVESNT